MGAYLNPIGQGPIIAIDKAVVMVGRHPDCDVVLKCSRKVSRKHCCLVQVNDKYAVRDLGSMNGLRLNGKRVKRLSHLAFGDQLEIGDLIYQVEEITNGKANGSANGKKKPEQNADNRVVDEADSDALNDDPDGRGVLVDEKAQTPIVRPVDPLDLSQDYPVPIDDEEFELLDDADVPSTAEDDNSPLLEDDFIPADDLDDFDEDDDIDDVILLDD